MFRNNYLFPKAKLQRIEQMLGLLDGRLLDENQNYYEKIVPFQAKHGRNECKN